MRKTRERLEKRKTRFQSPRNRKEGKKFPYAFAPASQKHIPAPSPAVGLLLASLIWAIHGIIHKDPTLVGTPISSPRWILEPPQSWNSQPPLEKGCTDTHAWYRVQTDVLSLSGPCSEVASFRQTQFQTIKRILPAGSCFYNTNVGNCVIFQRREARIWETQRTLKWESNFWC